jgi:hypothetical protein
MEDYDHHIILAPASGNADQKWVFNGNVPGWWTNVGTGDVLKATFGGPITTVRSESNSSSELWTFVTP